MNAVIVHFPRLFFLGYMAMWGLPLISFAQAYPTPQGSPSVLTLRQWEADLDTLEANVPRLHGNAFHAVPEKRFREAVQSLRSQLGTLNEDQILTEFARLIGMIQDGHNYIDITRGTGRSETYPLRVTQYPEGIFIEHSAPEAAGIVGGRLVSIDGLPADSVLQRVLPLIPHDPGNVGFAYARLSEYMMNAVLLHGLGVTSSAREAEFIVEKDGQKEKMKLRPLPFARRWFYGPPPADWADARDTTVPPPLWRMHRDSTFWLTYLPGARILYAQINGISDGPSESLADFTRRMAEAVRNNHAERLVLDLRWNDGGNNYLLRPLIVNLLQMPDIDRRGHLFVFTGPRTFSAAQNLVNRLENFTEAVFVGGPTGENVNFYGDTRRFELPNSGCRISLANLWWQDKDPRDKRIATFPAIAVEETFQGYVRNTDPAMEYVLHHAIIPTLEDIVLQGLQQEGYRGALKAFREFRSDPIHKYYESAILEGDINNLGYRLLSRKRTADAISIFKVNTEEFPASFNTWDSLGEGYAAAGRKDEAIAAYKESLRLNPTSPTGLEALSKLQK